MVYSQAFRKGTATVGKEFTHIISTIIANAKGFERVVQKFSLHYKPFNAIKQQCKVEMIETQLMEQSEKQLIAGHTPSCLKLDGSTKTVELLDGGKGKCTARFTVGPEDLNRNGYLHGGFTATVIDMVTTFAVMSAPKPPGLSVDLHVSYFKAAKEGDEILVNANTIRAGRKLAFIECELVHKKDGSLIAKGCQTKYVDV